MTEAELIARHVEENPRKPGPPDARLKDSGVAVWAFIAYLHAAVGGDLAQAASDYELSPEAAQAALAYYRRHQSLIDARIAWNAA
jgi:uncharacterized protein (DUF433 family)